MNKRMNKRINSRTPSLGERVAAKRHLAELEKALEAGQAAGMSPDQALELLVRVGSVGLITALAGNSPMWPLAAVPLGHLERRIVDLREAKARPTLGLVHPDDHAQMAERAGAKRLCGADGRPVGPAPAIFVAGVQLRPWAGAAPGWATLFEALLTMQQGAPAEAPAETEAPAEAPAAEPAPTGLRLVEG